MIATCAPLALTAGVVLGTAGSASAAALPIPLPVPIPIVGSCSHPCGTGLAAILVGPRLTVLITTVALLIQALFLAHGGLTTLGADVMSMGIVGGYAGFAIFRVARQAVRPVHGARLRHTRYRLCATALRRLQHTSMCLVECPTARE